MTSSAGRFTTLCLEMGLLQVRASQTVAREKEGNNCGFLATEPQKTQKGSTLIIHILGIKICRSSFLPDNPFSHLSWFPSHLPVAHQEQSAPSCKSWIPCYHSWSRRLTVASVERMDAEFHPETDVLEQVLKLKKHLRKGGIGSHL